MERSTKRRGKRWSDRPRTSLHPTDVPRMPRHEREESPARVLGPYESTYDVSLGYSHDRSIVVP